MPDATPPSSLKSLAFADLDRELAVTRRVLERLPADKLGWQPHAKSMSLGRLAMHVANLPRWLADTLDRDEFDMGAPQWMRDEPQDLSDVLQTFDENAAAAIAAMARMDAAALARDWKLRQGEKVLFQEPKALVARRWCLSHLIHHRAQLCVYLRLHDVPVPAVYFNSADEPEWVFA
jgi:uncharacterized damage-inducible protein DinB